MNRWGKGLLVVAGVAVLALTVSVVRAATAPPASTAIVWTDFDAGTKFAMKNNLPVMMDFATSWCGWWCKKLDKEVYTNADVVELSKKFVCIKLDGDKQKQLVEKYKVTGYPTIIFTNAKGEEAARIPGFMPAEDFAKEMKGALAKLGADKTNAKDAKDTKTK